MSLFKVKARVPSKVRKVSVSDTPSKVRKVKASLTGPGLQSVYTRGCMLLLFHKVLYEHRAEPCISDAEYDRLERCVERLEASSAVKAHPDAPTGKRPCPHLRDLPRTVLTWLERYDQTGRPPTMLRGV